MPVILRYGFFIFPQRFTFRHHPLGFFLHLIGLGLIVQQHDFIQGIEQTLQVLLPHLGFELAFPQLDDMPSFVTKLDTPVQIPLPIAFNLCFPELRVGFGKYIIFTTFMSVPEASVHEDAGAVFPQYNVGRAGQFLHIDTETIAVCKKEFPHNHFRLGVLAPDVCHAFMALFGSEFVWHGAKVHENSQFQKSYDIFGIGKKESF